MEKISTTLANAHRHIHTNAYTQTHTHTLRNILGKIGQ